VFHVLSTLQTAGAETTSVAVVSRLRLAGVDARLATMREDRDGLPATTARELVLPRHHLGARRIVSPRGLLRLVSLARQHRPAILHAEDRDAALLCAAAAKLAKAPLVITRHVLDEPAAGRRGRWKRSLLGAVLRRADRVVAVSDAVARRLHLDDRVDTERISTVYNSLDPDLFPQLSPSEARTRLGWPQQPTVVLVAALRPGKGHEVALDAMRLLRNDHPDARLVFVGDGELRARLESSAEGAVDFVGDRSDVPLVLAAADVVVLPSDGEALPTVLIEAALAGRATVATAVGGIPEVVVEGVTGLIVPPQDPAALSAAIAQLLSDQTMSTRFGGEARRRAVELFSPQRQIAALVDLYATCAR
jgi:glycosyltransferase involved in cell wall biosynthesis